MHPDAVLEESRRLRQALRRYPTRRDWLASSEGAELQQQLDALLHPIHRVQGVEVSSPSTGSGGGPSGDLRPGPSLLRYVHWNILHGNEHGRVLHALHSDPHLRDADLVSLNEVDIGMRRSSNLDVAQKLASELGMQGAWCALFLELNGGETRHQRQARQERWGPDAENDDREALFGLCLLSRYPLREPQRLVLEGPADLLFDREGKAGDFVALQVTVEHPVQPFTVVVTHLDVHGDPARRCRQMQQILAYLPPGPALISGDFNTTTFERGGLARALRAFSVLALSPGGALRNRLLRPDTPAASPREPLFQELRRAGFDWRHCNEERESLDLLLKDVQEVQDLPGGVRAMAAGVLQHVESRTRHRLDWLASRDLEALPESVYTGVQWMRGAQPASDHAPIACTFNVSAAAATPPPR